MTNFTHKMTLIEFQIQSESNSATQNIGKPKDRQTTQRYRFVFFHQNIPVDTGRNLNVHKTFRRRPGCLLNVLCTFNLRPVSTGILFFPDGFFSINLKPLLPFFFCYFSPVVIFTTEVLTNITVSWL